MARQVDRGPPLNRKARGILQPSRHNADHGHQLHSIGTPNLVVFTLSTCSSRSHPFIDWSFRGSPRLSELVSSDCRAIDSLPVAPSTEVPSTAVRTELQIGMVKLEGTLEVLLRVQPAVKTSVPDNLISIIPGLHGMRPTSPVCYFPLSVFSDALSSSQYPNPLEWRSTADRLPLIWTLDLTTGRRLQQRTGHSIAIAGDHGDE